MDDGAQDLHEAVRLCALGRSQHIRQAVATPHFNAMGDIDNFLARRDARAEELRNALRQKGIGMEIYCGAEVFVDDDIFFSKNLRRLTINNSRYLLVEFDFYGNRLQNILEYLDELYSMQVVPIIAHPERYAYFQRDYDAVNELASRGVLFQVNAGSLASRDGREEFELAYEMVFKGVAAFIGTDAHSAQHRPNDIGMMLRQFPQDIHPRLMQHLLEGNAQCVLNDTPLPPHTFSRLEKRRFY